MKSKAWLVLKALAHLGWLADVIAEARQEGSITAQECGLIFAELLVRLRIKDIKVTGMGVVVKKP